MQQRSLDQGAKIQTLTQALNAPIKGLKHSNATHTGILERLEGIEPSYSAWKAAALPLSYTRLRRSLCQAVGG